MSAIAKEKIFVELREYHTHQFPAKVKNETVANLISEFGTLEDKIISMILSLSSGKIEFVDSVPELNNFQKKLERSMPETGQDQTSRKLFLAKISKLSELSSMAKQSGFVLRPVKVAKAV